MLDNPMIKAEQGRQDEIAEFVDAIRYGIAPEENNTNIFEDFECIEHAQEAAAKYVTKNQENAFYVVEILTESPVDVTKNSIELFYFCEDELRVKSEEV